MTDVSIVDLDTQVVMGMHQNGRYEIIATMLKELFEFILESDAEITGPPVFLCHEITEEEAIKANQSGNANIEVAIPVSECIENSEDKICYQLDGCRVAQIVHQGPYEEAEPTYHILMSWLNVNGKKITGPIREYYLNDPLEVAPEEILTRICAPIDEL